MCIYNEVCGLALIWLNVLGEGKLLRWIATYPLGKVIFEQLGQTSINAIEREAGALKHITVM